MLVWPCSHTCSVLHGCSLKQWGESRGQIESKATHLCKRRHFQGNHLLVPDLFFYGQFPSMERTAGPYCLTNDLLRIIGSNLQWANKSGELTCFPLLSKEDTVSLATDSVWAFFPLRKYKQEGSPATWNLVSKQISLPQAAEITNLVLEHHSALDLYFVFMVKSLTNNKG